MAVMQPFTTKFTTLAVAQFHGITSGNIQIRLNRSGIGRVRHKGRHDEQNKKLLFEGNL